jgi:hypothetical protein
MGLIGMAEDSEAVRLCGEERKSKAEEEGPACMAEERGGSVPLHLLPQPEWTARHCPRCPRLTLPLSRATVTGVHGIGRGGSRAGRRTGRGLALEAEMEQAGAPAAGRLDCRSEYTPPSPTEPWLATPLPLPRWRRLSWRAHYGRGPRGCDPASSYTQLSPPAPWPAMRPPQRLPPYPW